MFNKLQELREEREQGFTLIELLVVILIIGILAAISIPMFLNQRKSAVDSSVQSDIRGAATAVETWMVSNPNAAVTASTLVAPATGAANTPLAGAKLSEGVTLKLIAGTNGVGSFKICATHAGGDISRPHTATASDPRFEYDSHNGGLNKVTSGTC